MAIDIKVPAAGESITSANIAKWYKSNGDFVKKGDALVSLETDKVSNELEAEADGILTITVGEGEEVSIGTVIGQIAPAAGSSTPVAAAQSAAAHAPVQAAPAPAAPVATGAAVEIVVPAAGESITSANVAAWRKKDGDFCEKGEILVTLETDKVSNELEAPVSGTLQILVHEGEVSIGKVIGMIAPGQGAAVSGQRGDPERGPDLFGVVAHSCPPLAHGRGGGPDGSPLCQFAGGACASGSGHRPGDFGPPARDHRRDVGLCA